jgi:ribosomal protein S27AE
VTDEKKKFPPPPSSGTGRMLEIPLQTGDPGVRKIETVSRSRFSVIVEEFGIEDRGDEIVATPQLIVSGSFVNATTEIRCPRCGAGAFTRGLVGDEPGVVCRGCPPPAPVYTLNNAVNVALKMERYRCSSCGQQDFVTMTLSDVNLYCRGCSKLTLHAKQADQVPKPFTRRGNPPIITTPEWSGGIDDGVVRWKPPLSPPQRKEEDKRREEARVYDITINELRMRLGLEPFDEFSAKMRVANIRDRDLKGEDVARRTGRTTKGILETLAWCIIKQSLTMHVRSATPSHDRWLVQHARELCTKVKILYPRDIEIAPSDSVDGLSPKRGVMLYVDHHYHEAVARVRAAEAFAANSKTINWTCRLCGRTKVLGWIPEPDEVIRCKCERERKP